MIVRNRRKSVAVVAVLVSFISWAGPILAATLANQSDIGKVWKTGGLKVNPSVAVSGQSFKTAVSFTVPKKMARSWDAQAGLNPKAPLHKGDALLATFYIRSARPGCQASFAVEGGPKFERVAWRDIKLSNKWQKLSVPLVSRGTYGAGKWQVTFKLGSAAQTVQIANFSLVKK